MKIYIITDLEGCALISRWNQTRAQEVTPEDFAVSRKLLTGEVNAAIDGILDAQPDAEVTVWGGHGDGSMDPLDFHPKAMYLGSGPIPPHYYMKGHDALFFVGQHAMAGTKGAVLCHTYSYKTKEYYKLNGRFVGEFGARATLAGTLGMPTVFISGDDKTIAEAKALVPGIHGAIVKEGLGEQLAIHLSHKAACELIRKTAAEAVKDIGRIPPIKLDPPYELEIRFAPGVSFDHLMRDCVTKIDDQTMVVRTDDFCELKHI